VGLDGLGRVLLPAEQNLREAAKLAQK